MRNHHRGDRNVNSVKESNALTMNIQKISSQRIMPLHIVFDSLYSECGDGN
jgi:hypothetical protein